MWYVLEWNGGYAKDISVQVLGSCHLLKATVQTKVLRSESVCGDWLASQATTQLGQQNHRLTLKRLLPVKSYNAFCGWRA